jgi:hypothetical protein
VEGAGHEDALDLKHWWVAVSQHPIEPLPPHAAVQSPSPEQLTDSHAGGGGGGGGGFVPVPVPDGAGSVAGAACVGCVSGPGPGSEDAHAAMRVPATTAAAA